jgi:acyl-CoA thioester hydrolase
MPERLINIEAEVEVEIPFQDNDPMGVTWHGNYLRYWEGARAALLGKIGYGYAQMTASGYLFPIVEARIKFIKPTTFGQRVRVRAALEEYENRLKIAYVIANSESGETVSKGFTIQVAVAKDNGEMCFCSPPVLIEKVRACVGSDT